jgi:uncharacterized protein (DUF1800 family)
MKVVSGQQARKSRTWFFALAIVVATFALTACGGGGSSNQTPPPSPPSNPSPNLKPTRAEAARFLTQATFGPTESDIDAVVAQGYEAWLDAQLAKAPSVVHQAQWDKRNVALGGGPIPIPGSNRGADARHLPYSFWKQALSGSDQVRARVAYAWSQIFVISAIDSETGFYARGIANYLDMLNNKGLGKYRDLLEGVSLHPSMGMYLTSARNRKENTATGRVPDENYAREVLQLFSIGLVELNPDGTHKLTAGVPKDSYTPEDVTNLARVFTGWSWACPASDDRCFNSATDNDGNTDTDRLVKPMRAYPQFHSSSEKKFVSRTIPDQGDNADPTRSLKLALDTLASHPNVGPFIAKQLIQRMVTSNPSPAYVGRAASAFTSSGGDLKALVKAVLLDPEARSTSVAAGGSFGKLREPLLRATAFFRAFGATSDSGDYIIGTTDDPGTSLGQTVMRSPSVFNFYRPGFKPNSGKLGEAGLLAPEMQITHETTVAGYANTMRLWVDGGAGSAGHDGKSTKGPDVKPAYLTDANNNLIKLADQPAALVETVNQRLLYGTMPPEMKTQIVSAISKIIIPAANGTNQTVIATARKNRLKSAIYLTLLSPEFVVQK